MQDLTQRSIKYTVNSTPTLPQVSICSKLLAYGLSFVLAFPGWLGANYALADIIADPNAPIDYRPTAKQLNGIEVIDIVAPNASGISHNQYQNFSIERQGAILNNNVQAGHSQLGGAIGANTNLQGQAASLILNEVTSSNRSDLKGALEVSGKQAEVIIANPNGISCDGCGFINTPKISLTTGTPQYQNQALNFNVEKGQISIGNDGLYGDKTQQQLKQIKLIAKQLKIDGEVIAKDKIKLIAGSGTYQHQSQKFTPKAHTQTPALAIDASAYGAMRAGQIEIIATDAGAGVNTQGYLGADAGDLIIQSAGDIKLKRADARANIRLQSAQTIQQNHSLRAQKQIHINSQQYQSNQQSKLVAHNIQVQTQGQQTHQGHIQGAHIKLYSQQNLKLQGAKVQSGEQMHLNAQRNMHLSDTLIQSNQLKLSSTQLKLNNSQLAGITQTDLNAAQISLDSRSRLSQTQLNIQANDTLEIQGKIDTHKLQIKTNELHHSGQINSLNSLNLQANNLYNQGKLYAQGQMRLNLKQALYNQGHIQGQTQLNLETKELFNQTGGLLHAGEQLQLDTHNLNNQGDILTGRNQNHLGTLQINLQGQLHNQGLIQAGNIQSLGQGQLINSGKLIALTHLKLQGATLDNRPNGLILLAQNTQPTAHIQLSGRLFNQGQIISAQTLYAQAGDIHNQGLIFAKQDLKLTALSGNLLNKSPSPSQQARLFAGQQFDLNAHGKLINDLGSIQAQGHGQSQIKAQAGVYNLARDLGRTGGKQYYALDNGQASTSESDWSDTLRLPFKTIKISTHYYNNNRIDFNYLLDTTRYVESSELLTSGGSLSIRGNLNNHASLVMTQNGLNVTGHINNQSHSYQAQKYQASRSEKGRYRYYHHIDNKTRHADASNFAARKWRNLNSVTQSITKSALAQTYNPNNQILTLNNGYFKGRRLFMQVNRHGQQSMIGTQANLFVGGQLSSHSLNNSGVVRARNLGVKDATQGQGQAQQASKSTPSVGQFINANQASNFLAHKITPNQQSLDLTQFIQPSAKGQPSLSQLLENPIAIIQGIKRSTYAHQLFTPSLETSKQKPALDERQALTGKDDSQFFLDPLQEARALRAASLKQTGRALFLPEWKTEREQRAALLENAKEYAQKHANLMGTALTQAQIAQLKKPIIWYEKRTINGKHTMVPKVYFPKATLAQMATDTNASIDADSLEVKIKGIAKNTGNLRVRKQGSIDAKRIENSKTVQREQYATGYSEHAGSGGNIHAQNLTLKSQTDIINNGGRINTTGNLKMQAKDNIKLNALALKRSSTYGSSIDKSTTYQTSKINTGGNSSFTAGKTFSSEGASVKSGGSIKIKATDIEIAGVTDSTYLKHEHKEAGNFSSTHTINKKSSNTYKGSIFESGQELALNAIKQIKLVGATVKAKDKIKIKAKDVLISAGISDSSSDKQTQEDGLIKSKSERQGRYQQTAVASLLEGTGGIEIDSTGGNVAILGSELKSANDIKFGSAAIKKGKDGKALLDKNGQYITEDGQGIKNLTIGTVELQDKTWHEKSEGYKGIFKQIAKATSIGLGVMGIKNQIKLSESERESTTKHTHQKSEVNAGGSFSAIAKEGIRIEGSEVEAKKDGHMQSDVISVVEVKDRTVTEHEKTTESISSQSTNLDTDNKEISLISVSEIKHTEKTSTSKTSLVTSKLKFGGKADIHTKVLVARAAKIEIGGDANVNADYVHIGGATEDNKETSSGQTDTTTIGVGVKNSYVDTLYAANAVKEAGEAVQKANIAYNDAKRSVKAGTLAPSALDEYKANALAAKANFAQASLALAGSGATAAASTATGGFYANASISHSHKQQSQSIFSQKWQGSLFTVGGNAKFKVKNDFNLQGSNLQVAKKLTLDAKKINVTAGVETTSSTSNSEEHQAGVSMSGSSSGFSGNASTQNSNSDSHSTRHILAGISAGSMDSTSKEFTVKGGKVNIAGKADVTTDKLTVASVQDTASNRNQSHGANISGGAAGISSVGGNASEGKGERKWTTEQSSFLVNTSGKAQDSGQIKAKHTHLEGGIIASAQTDKLGNIIKDNGDLNLQTETLTRTHLKDTDTQEWVIVLRYK